MQKDGDRLEKIKKNRSIDWSHKTMLDWSWSMS